MSLHPQLRQELPQAEQTPEDTSSQLHPAVYRAVAALLIWFVMAAWLLFGGEGYIDLAFAMISVLVFMVIAIPTALWWTKVRSVRADKVVSGENHAAGEAPPLDAWLQGEVATYTGRQKSTVAMMEILLPIAAVALGITALGIVFDLVRSGTM